jgi:hypothetical protein
MAVAHIAIAADSADEIATKNATLRTFYIGSHRCHLYAQPADRGAAQRASRLPHAW